MVVLGATTMTADLTNPIFTDDAKARQYLESVRWPRGPICPHCGIGPEGPTVTAPDHWRETIQKSSDGGTVSPSWFRPLVRG